MREHSVMLKAVRPPPVGALVVLGDLNVQGDSNVNIPLFTKVAPSSDRSNIY